jgi:uncharacterized protein (DUF362 family)
MSKKGKFFIVDWTGIDKSLLIEAMRQVDHLHDVKSGTRVFIKPNFTFPFFKPGVTTPPDLIRALVEILLERGASVTIGEGGASLDVFDLQDSFADHGLYDLKREYGIKVTHLREEPVSLLNFGTKKAGLKVPVPRILVDGTDLFVTLPVAKVHAMTTVSLATKNQWGCIAASKRFLHHPAFNDIITGLHNLLPRQMVVCDGRYVLTDNGPMFGTVKPGRFLSVGNDIGSFDVAMCRLMGFDPSAVSHIQAMMLRGLAPRSFEDIECNEDPAAFRPCEFRLRRTLQNYVALCGFHSSLITWFGYDSFAERFLHKALYTLKPNPLAKEVKERQLTRGKAGE